MEISKEDLKTLALYYDKMHSIVVNNACSGISVEMRNAIEKVLTKYNMMPGCPRCGQGIIQMMVNGCRLYVQNRPAEKEKQAKKKDAKL